MEKQNNTVLPGYASYLRGTETAEVEGVWLSKDPNTCPNTQMTVIAAAPRLGHALFYSSLPLCMREPHNCHIMMSQSSAPIFQQENHCTCTEELP